MADAATRTVRPASCVAARDTRGGAAGGRDDGDAMRTQLLTAFKVAQKPLLDRPARARCVATLQEHTNEVYCVAYTPDGSQLVSGSGDY
jgi:WD40 repeat protein